MASKFAGITPAFYACYDKEGNISPAGVREFTEYLIGKGVQGLYVGGSSGECIYHSVEERKLVLENVMAVAKGRIFVIAHVACNNTKDSQELARHAESLGADAIASIPPIYFKLPEHAIAKYRNDISAAAPNTPFIIYNIPQLAGVSLTMSLFREMLKNPMVKGVKNSSMPTQDIQMFKMYGGEDFTVFNGPDEQFIAGRAIGADGGIGGTYAVMPELFLAADEAFKKGDMERAKGIQWDIDAIIYKLCEAKGNLYATMKEVIKRRTGIDLGSVRAPLAPLAESDEPVVQESVHLIDEAIRRWA